MIKGANVAPGRSSTDHPKAWKAEERRRVARSRAVGELLYTKLIAPGIDAASRTILKAVKRDARLAKWLLDVAREYSEQGAVGPETEEAVVENLDFFEKLRDQGLPQSVKDEPDAGGSGRLSVVPGSEDDLGPESGGSATGS